MKKYKEVWLSLAFLTLIFTAGLSNGLFSDRDDGDRFSRARSEMVLLTFENNDYESWRRLIGKRSGLSKLIDKDDFHRFVVIRQTARLGNYDKAVKLALILENDLKLKSVII